MRRLIVFLVLLSLATAGPVTGAYFWTHLYSRTIGGAGSENIMVRPPNSPPSGIFTYQMFASGATAADSTAVTIYSDSDSTALRFPGALGVYDPSFANGPPIDSCRVQTYNNGVALVIFWY